MINFLSAIEWIFDGIGSTIIGTVLGLIIGGVSGGFIGYRISLKNRINQKQKAGDNSKQKQIGSITNNNCGDILKDEK